MHINKPFSVTSYSSPSEARTLKYKTAFVLHCIHMGLRTMSISVEVAFCILSMYVAVRLHVKVYIL